MTPSAWYFIVMVTGLLQANEPQPQLYGAYVSKQVCDVVRSTVIEVRREQEHQRTGPYASFIGATECVALKEVDLVSTERKP